MRPGHKKSVINVDFLIHVPGQYSGYVHVKTSQDNLVVPVEINVLRGGVYAYPSLIDFGTIHRESQTRSALVSIVNGMNHKLALTGFSLLTDTNSGAASVQRVPSYYDTVMKATGRKQASGHVKAGKVAPGELGDANVMTPLSALSVFLGEKVPTPWNAKPRRTARAPRRSKGRSEERGVALDSQTFAQDVLRVQVHGSVDGETTGHIVLRTNDTSPLGSRVEIPYRAVVIRGTLKLESKEESLLTSSSFFSGQAVMRTEIFLVNEFTAPVALSRVYVDDANFRVVNAAEATAMTAGPGDRLGPLVVERQAAARSLSSMYETPVHVITNISTRHTFPLQVSGKTGRLEVERAVPRIEEDGDSSAAPDCIELAAGDKRRSKSNKNGPKGSRKRKKKRRKRKGKKGKRPGQRFHIPSQTRVKVAIGSRDYRILSHQELARRLSQVSRLCVGEMRNCDRVPVNLSPLHPTPPHPTPPHPAPPHGTPSHPTPPIELRQPRHQLQRWTRRHRRRCAPLGERHRLSPCVLPLASADAVVYA